MLIWRKFGYWGGLAPDGKIVQKYKTVTIDRLSGTRRALPLGGRITVVGAKDVQKFYDDFYRFLASCGIDSVKTDAQFYLDEIESAPDRCALISSYQDAWTISSLRYFSIKAISCM